MGAVKIGQLLTLLVSLASLTETKTSAGTGAWVRNVPRAGRLRPRDTTYTTSVRNPNPNVQFGTLSQVTTVNAGVTVWLSGLGTHNFYGNVNNYGQILISQTDFLATAPAGGQTSDYSGATTTNGNLYTGAGSLISLNDFGSASAPTYDWNLETFQNYGALQMCGRGDTGGSTYQLFCYQDCYNYGLIDMGQYYGNLGGAFFWGSLLTTSDIFNNGAFRIVNVTFHNRQNVYGTGCWIIGSFATLYMEDGSGALHNPTAGPTFPDQSITFTDNTGTLHMDTAVYSRNADFGAPVYGFGNNNAIEFYQVYTTTNPYSYSTSTGILTVNFIGGYKVNINIGTGYDTSLFYTGRNPKYYNTAGYNAIFYRGAPPAQALPSQCGVGNVQQCGDPALTASAFAASSTATSSTIAASTGPSSATVTSPGATATTASPSLNTGYVTTTLPYTGSAPFTSAITITGAQPSGTAPGTVYVSYADAVLATVTLPYTGTGFLDNPTTITIPPSGTAPGTVEILTPTITRPATIATNIGPNQCVCRPVPR